MRTSVVIPVRNQAGCIRWTLESLAAQDAGPFEVVVVDDGSTDSTGAVASSFTDRLDLKLVRNATAQGRGAARNRGAAAATGDHLILLDADSFSPPDLVRRHIQQAAAELVVIGRRVEMGWWTMGRLAAGDSAVQPLAFEGDQRDSRGLSDTEGDVYARTPWLLVATHNMSVPADLFGKLGGFDEGLRGWGYEDNEFAYRVFRHFGREPGHFIYDEELLCYHMPHFRDWAAEWANTTTVLPFIKDKHRHFDVEFLQHPPNHARIAQTLPYYERGLAHVSAQTDPKVIPAAAETAAVPAGSLWIGCGTSRIVESDPRAAFFDHDLPPGDDNHHLFGAHLPYPDDTFPAVVNVDLWRFLSPVDLSALVIEGLRVARDLFLVVTRHITDRHTDRIGVLSDITYLSEMFVGRYAIDVVADDDRIDVVRFRRGS